MNKIAIIIAFALLAGCEVNTSELSNYRCTNEQLDIVDREFEICNKSSYMSSYCFEQARKAHCDKLTTGGE